MVINNTEVLEGIGDQKKLLSVYVCDGISKDEWLKKEDCTPVMVITTL